MKGRVLFGIILVTLGLGIILDNLGLWDFSSVISIWWPLILVLIGAVNLVDKKSNRGGDIALMLIGIFILLYRRGIIGFNVLQFFWPALLIIAGIWILLGRNKFPKNITVSEDFVDYFVLFSGLENNNVSKNFKGGRIFAAFGGVNLDLRGAFIEGQEAELEVFAAFGGVDIKVPENWRVVIGGIPLFGAWENKTRVNQDILGPTLKIKCTVAFGGVEVKN